MKFFGSVGLLLFSLVGYSMGGVVAHWISIKYPEIIKSLVSLDGIITPDLVNIYKYWSENTNGFIEDYARDPRNTEIQKSRILNNDREAIRALSLGLAQSISNNLAEFLSMPDPAYPYLVLVSNWENQSLDLDAYLNWAKSSTTYKKYMEFDHGDFIYRSEVVIQELIKFYGTIN